MDPPGLSLYNKIKYGVTYASHQSEQQLQWSWYDTLAEGIGLDKATANFGCGCERRFLFPFSLTQYTAIFAEVEGNFETIIFNNQLGCSVKSSFEILGSSIESCEV